MAMRMTFSITTAALILAMQSPAILGNTLEQTEETRTNRNDPPTTRKQSFGEYEIKAGFIYRFLSFVNWPESHKTPTTSIGIVGDNPFGNAFDAITERSKSSKPITVRFIRDPSDINAMRTCQLIFIASSEGKHLRRILDRLGDHPTLTIGDGDRFIDRGGMIGFVNKANGRIGIALNVAAANRCGITMRSMLKRIATRIIDTPINPREP